MAARAPLAVRLSPLPIVRPSSVETGGAAARAVTRGASVNAEHAHSAHSSSRARSGVIERRTG